MRPESDLKIMKARLGIQYIQHLRQLVAYLQHPRVVHLRRIHMHHKVYPVLLLHRLFYMICQMMRIHQRQALRHLYMERSHISARTVSVQDDVMHRHHPVKARHCGLDLLYQPLIRPVSQQHAHRVAHDADAAPENYA